MIMKVSLLMGIGLMFAVAVIGGTLGAVLAETGL
jgi:hypothetical protein